MKTKSNRRTPAVGRQACCLITQDKTPRPSRQQTRHVVVCNGSGRFLAPSPKRAASPRCRELISCTVYKSSGSQREEPMALGSFVYASLEQVLIHPHQSGYWELRRRNMHSRHTLQKKITKRGKKVELEAESEARNVNTGDSPRPASCVLLP